MNDFTTQLSGMFDDIAAGINPRPDFEAVYTTPVPVVSNGAGVGRRFPRLLGIAAVSVSLLGGGVAAFQMVDGEPDAVATTSKVTPEPVVTSPLPVQSGGKADAPLIVIPPFDKNDVERPAEPAFLNADESVEHSAELGKAEIDGGAIWQKIFGTAERGEEVFAASEFGSASVVTGEDARWQMVLELTEVPEAAEVPIRVSFGIAEQVFEFVIVRPAEPKPETTEPPKEEPKQPVPPKEEPKPVPPKPPKEEPKPEPPKEEPKSAAEFTVQLAELYNVEAYMKQVFWGTAPAGSVITASSEWGSVDTTAGSEGHWEMRLKMFEVPHATVVHVSVTANTGGPVFEYVLVRNVPEPQPEPQPAPFTANLGDGYLDWTPMKQGLYGTGTPGSVVIASTDFGSADAVVDSKGKWEMLLKMHEVPDGTTVGVRVTNNSSESVFEFGLLRPVIEPDPVPIDFTAQAAFVECDSTPPFNEYWGTSTAGAKITISSVFGGKQVVANGDGNWAARVEFPEAPLGETFMVTITSSKGEAVYSLPFKRISPA
jgi:hypothetical protein